MTRTDNDRLRSRARLRMLRFPGSLELKTVGGVERRTDMDDARIALCAATGVDLDDIDPSSGYDRSRRAYESSRTSWVDHIAMFGYSEFYDSSALAEALERWTAWNPAYTDGDDWLKAGRDAHHARQADIGRPCDRSSCDLHAGVAHPAPSMV